ncbi:MAG: hypothetical protein P4L79_16755 [Legionella sp.]|uniref:hypothetical protein n=1 Tax=Legionella sp. TaxID=459 RepID=UPI0028448252|nr:hypothetical protein [Legionella sp.]
MTTSSGILQSYLIDSLNAKTKLRHEELLKRHKAELLKKNLYAVDGGFLTPLNFYAGILADTDEILISYMSPEQKAQRTHDLQIAYLLLLVQREYELQHQKTENKADYNDKIKQCEKMLDKLNPVWQERIDKAPEQAYFTDGKPVQYLGIALGKEFAQQLADSGKCKTIREYVGALNGKRLYWVWGSSFLKTMLSLVPEGFYNAEQAGNVVKTPDPYTGCLSWGLYYFRFSMNFFLLLKHTVQHPWMSQDEIDEGWFNRFSTQWTQRKFTLLNDSLWATANLLCFFWLTGKGILGTAGDALTVALLLFDTSVALWDFSEQQALHNAQIQQYDHDIQQLNAEINKLTSDDEESKAKKLQLEMQKNALERDKKQCITNWTLQKIGLYTNIAYAAGLMAAFVVMAMPFVPIAAGLASTLGVVGAVVCFAMTVINNAVQSGIEIHKTKSALKDNEDDFMAQVNLLKKQVFLKKAQLPDDAKKLLFLEIKRLDAKTEHQQQTVSLQIAHLIRSIMLEAFIPAAIFSCLVFMPLGIGLGALAGGLALAMASNLLISASFTPDEKMLEVKPFDLKEYDEFCELLQEDKSSKDYHAFFKSKGGVLTHGTQSLTADDSFLDGEIRPVL